MSFIRSYYEGGSFFLSERMAYFGIPHAFYTRGTDEVDFTFHKSESCMVALRAAGFQDRILFHTHLVHGIDCLDVSQVTDTSCLDKKHADSLCSNNFSQALLVRTADCVPLLIANQNGSWVSAVHAGWRGLLSGVIENALSYVSERPSDLIFAIGPCIGANTKHFEVKEEVLEAFLLKGLRKAVIYHEASTSIDLSLACLLLLEQQGASQIDYLSCCTYKNKDLFYSHRRDVTHLGAVSTGRIGSVIGAVEIC